MKPFVPLCVVLALAGALSAQNGASPFVGRWDFTMTTSHGSLPDWLGVSENQGKLDVWYQPPTANVYQIKNAKLEGSRLVLTLDSGDVWDLVAEGGHLKGTQKHGATTVGTLDGVRTPELNHPAPAAWTTPEPLFNGHDLTGWEPTVPNAKNNWVARNGELVNESHGANLRTDRTFNDFKLHIEYNCPDDGNSGIYLRGRYEVQVEYEPLSHNPPERRMGSVYGRLTPAVDLPRKPGTWESYDITLVGRTVTVVRDGVTILDHKVIEGITGGALNAHEAEPGPIYIQGDHTGGLKFRNITIAVPK
jgi:hypothetical protein